LRIKYLKTLFTWRDPGIRIFFPAYLLIFGIENPLLNKEAKKYLEKLADVKDNSWEGLRESTLKAYGAYYSQKLL